MEEIKLQLMSIKYLPFYRFYTDCFLKALIKAAHSIIDTQERTAKKPMDSYLAYFLGLKMQGTSTTDGKLKVQYY